MSAEAKHAATEAHTDDADRAARDLTWDEAMRLAATDREQLAADLRNLTDQPRHDLRHRYVGGWRLWRRWSWAVVNDSAAPGKRVVVEGWAWTKRQSYRRRYRAYLRVLDGAA